MTQQSVPNSTSVLQHSSALPAQQFGRRAFGPQRRMSPQTVARNIVESIRTHQALGIERKPSFYSASPKTLVLVKTMLNAPTEGGLQ